MPYIDGKRVTVAEWQARFSNTHLLHTGPRGENPGQPSGPEAEAEDEQPAVAGRTPRAARNAQAAIADALGVAVNDPAVTSLDVTGLDAPTVASEGPNPGTGDDQPDAAELIARGARESARRDALARGRATAAANRAAKAAKKEK